jgi:phosphatidate phosphatase APP1
MRRKKTANLLSFYGLSNGTTNVLFGQITYFDKNDLSFQEYTSGQTFRTLLALYRAKPVAQRDIELVFNNGHIKTTTDAFGFFYIKVSFDEKQTQLTNVRIGEEEEARILEHLYSPMIDFVESHSIVISDIDDTILHSFISNKFLQFCTLMFTSVEKRKAVDDMMQLIKDFSEAGATSFYLSNSEQNLYPLIYRFLMYNSFPIGPIFLKHMRRLRDVWMNKRYPERDVHKLTQLQQIIELFPDKHYILIGDNTQNDLRIYLSIAEKYPSLIRHIIIREVVSKRRDEELLNKASEFLETNLIGLHYSTTFPSRIEL